MIILIIFLIVSIILNMVFLSKHGYRKMLVGIIVGKYKGNEPLDGFVVVEAVESYYDDIGFQQKRKIQGTYKVPSEYFDKINIGDEGLFPF